MLTADQIREAYRRVARRYDRTVAVFPVFGFRMGHYRLDAVTALGLAPGATVVELGCGTGLNFPLLVNAVSQRGRVTGVDLSDAMLAETRARVERRRWPDVDLVCADMADYRFPPGESGILSTFAIALSPAYDDARGAVPRILLRRDLPLRGRAHRAGCGRRRG